VTTLSPLLLAALLPLAADASKPLIVAGRVVGADDRPAGRVEVLVSGLGGVDGTLPILARTETDAEGHFRVTVPAEEDPNRPSFSLAVWAHRPGEGVGAVGVSRQKPPAEGSVAVKLGPPAHLDVRVLGPGGEPIEGAVVVPRMVRIDGGLPPTSSFPPPDELAARLSARTVAGGEGRMADVDPAAVQAIHVDAPAFGRQGAAPSADGNGVMTVRLAPVGRVTGIVVADDPSGVGGLTVRAMTRPQTPGSGAAMGEAGAVTDAGGRFAIPALAAGRLALNVVVPRGSGLSPRLPADRTVEPGKATEVEIPLKGSGRLRTLAGRVIDRRGEPVAGAVVFQSGDAPARTQAESDAGGRFRLPCVSEGRTFVFVRASGYRFLGRVVLSTDADITLAVTPEDQPPETPLATLPPPLPRAEELTLARRVLEPYADRVLRGGAESEKVQLLEVMARTEPARVLELVEKGAFAEPYLGRMMRMRVATGLRDDAPDEALAVIESIDDPGFRAMALVEASDALPAAERAKKRELVARAAVEAKGAKDPVYRLIMTSLVAERWLDLGDPARGEALLRANQADAEKMPNAAFAGYARAVFAEELAQVDLKSALALIATLTDPREFDRHHGNIAHELAARDSEEAERVLGLVRDPFQRDQYAVRAVYRMARVDLARARRLAGAIKDSSLRGYGLGMAALGLAEADKRAEAAVLLDEAFAVLERASEATEGQTPGWSSPASVAAALVPVAEGIDPRLVPGSFWRALSFRRPKPSGPTGFDPGAITDVQLAVMLARYDRAVARSLLDPLVGPDAPVSVWVGTRGLSYAAAAIIDPRWAVELIEALPDNPDLKAEPKNEARLAVAKVLSRQAVNRWRYLTSRHLHLWVPDIEDNDPNL